MNKSVCYIILTLLSTVVFSACHDSVIPNLPISPEPEEPSEVEQAVVDSMSVPPTSRAQRAEWLQQNAHALNTIQPTDENYSDLQPLKQAIGEARIVMLGEESYWDGSTLLAKTRLVKFLHQEMGFDVIAIESNTFDHKKAWEDLLNGMDPTTAFRNATRFCWGYSAQVEPLIDYIGDNIASNPPLELIGLDCEFTGNYAGELLLPELNVFLTSIGVDTNDFEGWSTFAYWLDMLANREPEDPDEEKQVIFFETLSELLIGVTVNAPAGARVNYFWQQVLENIGTQAKRLWGDWGLGRKKPPPDYWNMKSEQMGRNLLSFADQIFPDRKIIVWAAARHVCRSINDEVTDWGWAATGFRSMGDVVWEAKGSELYTLAFMAYQGTIYSNFGANDRSIGPIWNSDFEDVMNAAGFENAFLDLRNIFDYRHLTENRLSPENGAWFRQHAVMSPIDYKRLPADDWTTILDGVIFTRDMMPSTKSVR